MDEATLPDARLGRAALKQHLAELGAELDAVKSDAEFQRFMDTMARFWMYSLQNQWFILYQRPDATLIAGRRTWEKAGRRVVAEEKAIYIYAPTGKGFIGVPVFDIAQTEGTPLPVLNVSAQGETEHVAALERAAATLGIRVTELGPGRASGISKGGEVALVASLTSLQRASILAHELAHEILHQPRRPTKHPPLTNAQRETEAEATAYVIMRTLGLPSHAPAYIAMHGGDKNMLLRSLTRIQRAARKILDASRQKRRRSATTTRMPSTAYCEVESLDAA